MDAKEVFKLVIFPPAFGLRNLSPFCLKIEMLLTSLGMPFEIVEEPDPRKGPKGKLPYLNANGECIADSELITEYLDSISGGRVYGSLGEHEKAQGFALSRLVEDHLYWIMVASRWLDTGWRPNAINGILDFVPKPIRPIAGAVAVRQVKQAYDLHGLGRHSLEEQRGFAIRDLTALNTYVTNRDFLFDDKPAIFDFTVASVMSGIYDNSPATWLTEIAMSFDELFGYTERVQAVLGIYGRIRRE